MTKLTKIEAQKLEAQQKHMHFNRRLNMLPTSIREVYSGIGGEDTLVARELRGENNELVFGISYVNGEPVEAYTADRNGRRVPFVPVKASEDVVQKPSKAQELMAGRLEQLAQKGNEVKPKVRRVISRKMAEERTKKNLMAAAVQASKQETH